MKSKFWFAALAVMTFVFAGCGGGGSSAPPQQPAVNNIPVATDDNAATEVEVAIDIDVLANDSDPDGDPLVITAVSSAIHGAAAVNASGTIRYSPNAGFNGTDSFTYTIEDGRSGSATATVSVTVSFPGGRAIERVSVASDGTQGNFDSWMGFSSWDGRYVVFHAGASNLVPGAPTDSLLLRDRLTSQTSLVSSDSSGLPGDFGGQQPVISADDRFIAFSSFASNLVPGDTNGESDVFVKNLLTGATERISVASDGSPGDGGSFAPSISRDGRFVAFVSMAANFFVGDVAATWDIFVRDRLSGQTEHIASGGNFNDGPSISGDGRYVGYPSSGQIMVHDRQTGQSSIASTSTEGVTGNGPSDYPSLSADGGYIAFTSAATNLVVGDSNGVRDLFLRHLSSGTTTRVSVASSGAQGNAAVSDQEKPGISGDGRFIAFTSAASNYVDNDLNGVSDAFIHDRAVGQTRRVSLDAAGVEANGASGDSVLVSLALNGEYVVFTSSATNLVSGDTNNFGDVFAAPNPFAQ